MVGAPKNKGPVKRKKWSGIKRLIVSRDRSEVNTFRGVAPSVAFPFGPLIHSIRTVGMD